MLCLNFLFTTFLKNCIHIQDLIEAIQGHAVPIVSLRNFLIANTTKQNKTFVLRVWIHYL